MSPGKAATRPGDIRMTTDDPGTVPLVTAGYWAFLGPGASAERSMVFAIAW